MVGIMFTFDLCDLLCFFYLSFVTLGARHFSSAVSSFGQVFIVTRGSLAREPKMCRPSANTENSRCTPEKPLVPKVVIRKQLL